MKYLYLAIALVSIPAAALTKPWGPCDQKVYDNIYKAIVVKALDTNLKQIDIDDKNNSIVVLRALCRGQISSWEKGAKQ